MDENKKSWKRKRHHSDEAKKKISIANKKALTNPLLRKYLSDIQKGQHHSVKTEFKKGHKYIPGDHHAKFQKSNITGTYLPRSLQTHYTRDWQRLKRREIIEVYG